VINRSLAIQERDLDVWGDFCETMRIDLLVLC
jgi:hypothetical protein